MVSLHAALRPYCYLIPADCSLGFLCRLVRPMQGDGAHGPGDSRKRVSGPKGQHRAESDLAAKYGVAKHPCFVMLVDGQEVDRITGSNTTFSRLERLCKITSPPQPPNRSPGLLAQNAAPPQGAFPETNVPPGSGSMPGYMPRREDPNVIPASFAPSGNATSLAAPAVVGGAGAGRIRRFCRRCTVIHAGRELSGKGHPAGCQTHSRQRALAN